MKNSIYKNSTATLAEVAQKAGISRQTAGRILGNGAHKHKPETVERVKLIAEALGYRPNLLAKSVVAGRTLSIGILLPTFNSDDFFAQVVSGIQSALADTDYIPLFLQTSENNPELSQIHRLLDRRVDGIILIPHATDVKENYFNEISQRNLPVVCVNAQLQNIEPVDFVGTDEFSGGMEAANFLLLKGHTRFCSIQHNVFSENMNMRHQGFFQTLEKAGHACETVELPGWTLEENLAALLEYLKRPNRPTAFFCATDTYAAQLYKAAEQLRLSVGEDLAVFGFADLHLAQYLSPALTTLRQDGHEIGRMATRMLLERINGYTGDAREIRLAPELVERHSV